MNSFSNRVFPLPTKRVDERASSYSYKNSFHNGSVNKPSYLQFALYLGVSQEDDTYVAPILNKAKYIRYILYELLQSVHFRNR